MNYESALEMCGAEIHSFSEFGSYQGDWWAVVTYQDKTGWIHGYYGSCSGCDSFQGEFGDDVTHEHGDDNYYDPLYKGFKDDCDKCSNVKERLKVFGKSYLNYIITEKEAIRISSVNLEWDSDAQEIVDFIKEKSLEFEVALLLAARKD